MSNPIFASFVSPRGRNETCCRCIEARRPRRELASAVGVSLRNEWIVVYGGANRVPPCFIGMPQRSLASLVLGPLMMGLLCLALACVAGARTDRLTDTLAAADTLHAADSARADTARRSDSTRSADADSAAASQLAVVVDSASLKQQNNATQQGQTKGQQGGGGDNTSPMCCVGGGHVHRHGDYQLSPMAATIANALVFVPRDRAWFPVASRGRRMMVDIGRADLTLGGDSTARSAYLDAVMHLSPLPLGTALRIRAPYGIDEQAKVVGFDLWHGRIGARRSGAHLLDSLARVEDMLPATAVRIDTAAVRAATMPADTSHHATDSTTHHDSTAAVVPGVACTHDTLPTELTARAIAVRDSLVRFLTDSATPPYERQVASAKIQSWWVPGCFGIGRALVVANKRTPDMDFAVERVAIVDSTGKTVPMKVVDLRFHAHDPLYVFDADGDGVDDLAARGHGDRSGGLTIMRLDIAARRFVRLVSGFAWEQ